MSARKQAALARIRGKFLLSYDDCPEVRDLARRHRFQVRPVSVLYTLAAKGGPKRVRELLIANYPLARRGRG